MEKTIFLCDFNLREKINNICEENTLESLIKQF